MHRLAVVSKRLTVGHPANRQSHGVILRVCGHGLVHDLPMCFCVISRLSGQWERLGELFQVGESGGCVVDEGRLVRPGNAEAGIVTDSRLSFVDSHVLTGCSIMRAGRYSDGPSWPLNANCILQVDCVYLSGTRHSIVSNCLCSLYS